MPGRGRPGGIAQARCPPDPGHTTPANVLAMRPDPFPTVFCDVRSGRRTFFIVELPGGEVYASMTLARAILYLREKGYDEFRLAVGLEGGADSWVYYFVDGRS